MPMLAMTVSAMRDIINRDKQSLPCVTIAVTIDEVVGLIAMMAALLENLTIEGKIVVDLGALNSLLHVIVVTVVIAMV